MFFVQFNLGSSLLVHADSISKNKIIKSLLKNENLVYDENMKIFWQNLKKYPHFYGGYDASTHCDALEFAGFNNWEQPNLDSTIYNVRNNKKYSLQSEKVKNNNIGPLWVYIQGSWIRNNYSSLYASRKGAVAVCVIDMSIEELARKLSKN